MSKWTNVAVDQGTYEVLQKFCKDTGLSLVNATTIALRDWLEQVGPGIVAALANEPRKKRLISSSVVCITEGKKFRL